METSPKYLRRKEAAEYLKSRYGIGSRNSLDKLASMGGGPRFVKIGGAACYEPAALDDWMESRAVEKLATNVLTVRGEK